MSGVMIVTGGSRGIGAACASLAGARGYAVAVNYRERADRAEQVVAAIEDAGGRALAVRADVAHEAEVMRLFETVDATLGPLTALVNNAGTVFSFGPITDVSEASLARLWATNITSAFLCAREAVKRMSTERGGAGGGIVNISSAAARLGGPGQNVDYAASKGAIDTFTHGLALEVAGQGIRVNAVRPGLIETEIHAGAGSPDRVERIAPTVPMRRAGSAEEVAEAVLWLLSEQASYVAGTFVEVSGGR